jgi:hypothetical protein
MAVLDEEACRRGLQPVRLCEEFDAQPLRLWALQMPFDVGQIDEDRRIALLPDIAPDAGNLPVKDQGDNCAGADT